MDLQIIGEDGMADQIADQHEDAGRDHHRNNRQTIQPIGEIDRIGSADHDKSGEGEIEPADLQQNILEKGHGDRLR